MACSTLDELSLVAFAEIHDPPDQHTEWCVVIGSTSWRALLVYALSSPSTSWPSMTPSQYDLPCITTYLITKEQLINSSKSNSNPTPAAFQMASFKQSKEHSYAATVKAMATRPGKAEAKEEKKCISCQVLRHALSQCTPNHADSLRHMMSRSACPMTLLALTPATLKKKWSKSTVNHASWGMAHTPWSTMSLCSCEKRVSHLLEGKATRSNNTLGACRLLERR